MIDSDIAKLYGVTTKRLNEQVRRNINRFPADFMFQLSKEEYLLLQSQTKVLRSTILKSQNATSSWGGRRKLPFAFTEHGVIMPAAVLNSEIAVEASVFVVRAFIRLREIFTEHKELEQKMKKLELSIDIHDEQIKELIDAINQLLAPPETPKKKMGFEVREKRILYKKYI